MKVIKNKSGFTLLEIIIVIIIVGVLASLALPRFFATVEFSRAQEALMAMAAVRGSMERCYLSRSNTYVGCDTGNIDTHDPLNGQPNAHFAIGVTAQSVTGYVITSVRNGIDGGVAGGTVVITQNAATVTRSGSGAFSGIN